MNKIIKRGVSIVLSLSLIGTMGMTAFADSSDVSLSEDDLSPFIKQVIKEENMGQIKEKHTLYGANGEVNAYCLDFKNGYLIYDTNGEIVEYCETATSPLDDVEEKVYYTGPFDYYVRESGKFENVASGESISTNQLIAESKTFNSIANASDNKAVVFSSDDGDDGDDDDDDSIIAGATNLKKVKTALKNKPRTLALYRSDGNCGAVASTTLLLYYYDYIDSGIIKKTYANDPVKLCNYLYTYMTHGAATYDQLVAALSSSEISNKTISPTIKKGMSTVQKTWNAYHYLVKTNSKPAILLLQNHPTYKNHWVVTYGVIAYYNSDGKIVKRQYVVNNCLNNGANGTSKNDIKISCKYVSGFIHI